MVILMYRLRLLVRAFQAVVLWRWFRRQFRAPLPLIEGTTVIFAPHPDDETIGCGGLIATKRERNVPVFIVFLTDGRLCLGADYPDKVGLARTRRHEAILALSCLGVSEDALTFLELPDGGLRRLSQEERRSAVGQLANLIVRFAPAEILLPYRADCHDDHEAANSLVQEALKQVSLSMQPCLTEYLIWGVWEAPLFRAAVWRAPKSGTQLPLTKAALRKKRDAIAAYASQLEILPKRFVQEHVRPSELYFKSC